MCSVCDSREEKEIRYDENGEWSYTTCKSCGVVHINPKSFPNLVYRSL